MPYRTTVLSGLYVTADKPDTGGDGLVALDRQQPVRQGGASFAFDRDAGPPGPGVVVLPDQGKDTVEPPQEYHLDVTDAVRAWLDGGVPNHGLAIAPVFDSSVDEGLTTRFQVCGMAYNRP